MVRRHLNPEVVWKSDRVHLSGLAVTVGYTKRYGECNIMADRNDAILKLFEIRYREATFTTGQRKWSQSARHRIRH